MSRPTFENVLLSLLAVCTLTVTALVVRREFTSRSLATIADRHVPEWRQLSTHGNAVGPRNARVHLIIFSDFECPFCRKFAPITDSIHTAFPEVLIVERSFPLTQIHPHAYGAALAAECAAQQNAYWPMRDALFANPLRLAADDWGNIAVHAAVADTAALLQCVRSLGTSARVSADTIAGNAVGVSATPTVILNDIAFGAPPSFAKLRAAIVALEAGSVK